MKRLLVSAFMCAVAFAFGMNAEAREMKQVAFQKANAGRISFPAASLLSGRAAEGISSSDGDGITIEPLDTSEQYEEDETVRVRIQFRKEAVEAASLDVLIEKISKEALDGEPLNVHRKVSDNAVSVSLAFGKLDEVRAVEGVESAELEKQYETTETEGSSLPGNSVSEYEESASVTIQEGTSETADKGTEENSADQSESQQTGTEVQKESEALTESEELASDGREAAGQQAESVKISRFTAIAVIICCAAAAAAGYAFLKMRKRR